MNILYFNRSFYPDVEATGQLMTELCEDLTEKGHSVTVVVGKAYYVRNQKAFFFIRREKYKSIDIIRAGGIALGKGFLLLRIINLSFYFIFAFIGGFLVKQKPDVVITQTDPPVLGLLGFFFAKWYKAKFVYYCNDIYPDIGIITGKLTNPTINFLLDKITLFSFRNANKVICIGEAMQRKIINKNISKDRVIVIHNWADTSKLFPLAKNENPFVQTHGLHDKFIVAYSGNIGLTQNLLCILEVANYFKINNKVGFLIIGEGASKSKLIKLVKQYNLSNVNFLPYQPKETLQYSLSAADIHLIPFQKGLAGVMLPSKVYNILACGRPFISWVDKQSEIYDIAHKFKCGITPPAGSVRNMIRAINWAIKHPESLKKLGENGRKVATEYFDRKVSTSKFCKVLENVMSD